MDDAPAVYAYARDPDVSRFVSWDTHRSIDDSVLFLRGIQDRDERGISHDWCVEHSGTAIGSIGLFNLEPMHERAEVGYVLGQPHWRKGLGREALELVLEHAFCTLALRRVVANVRPENTASQRLLMAAGFRQEGLWRQHLYVKGEWWDMVAFGMLVGEFRPRSR